MKERVGKLILLLLISMLAVTGCGGGAAERGAENKETLIIGAAASLQESFTELGRLFEEEDSRWSLEFTFASSGNLKTSIEQGAPIDVFASAAQKQMNALVAAQLVDEASVKDFAKNALVVVVPEDSPVSSLEEVFALDRIAIGEPETVPAGQYAKESLTNLGQWEELEERLILAKDVRQCLFYVEQKEVDAGFVYATDAAKSRKVKVIISMPEESYSPVIYPMGIVSASARKEGARQWMDFVLSEKGREVLGRYGFQDPSE